MEMTFLTRQYMEQSKFNYNGYTIFFKRRSIIFSCQNIFEAMQANFNFCHFSIGGNHQHPLDIYAVPNGPPCNLLGEVVSATIGGMENNDNGGNIMRMDNNWQYEGPVSSDFHLDETHWDSK